MSRLDFIHAAVQPANKHWFSQMLSRRANTSHTIAYVKRSGCGHVASVIEFLACQAKPVSLLAWTAFFFFPPFFPLVGVSLLLSGPRYTQGGNTLTELHTDSHVVHNACRSNVLHVDLEPVHGSARRSPIDSALGCVTFRGLTRPPPTLRLHNFIKVVASSTGYKHQEMIFTVTVKKRNV